MWNVIGHFNDFDFYCEYHQKILSRGLKFMRNFYFQFQYRNSELYITFGNIPVIFLNEQVEYPLYVQKDENNLLFKTKCVYS